MILLSLIFEYIFVGSLNIIVKRSKWLWIVNSIVNFIVLLLIKGILPIHYHTGNWYPPLGINLVCDSGSFTFLILFSIIYPLINFYATYFENNDKYFYGFVNFLSASLINLSVANDMFNIFVSFELFSLIVFILIGLKKDGKTSIAAIRYIMVNMVAMNFYLVGLIMIYSQTGTLDLGIIAKRIVYTKFTYIAFSFIISALLTKSGLLLYSMWLPLAYSSSKTSVAALLASMEVPIFIVYRFYNIFPGLFDKISAFILLIGMGSMIIGGILATLSKRPKMTLAYSMISQSGVMFIGMSLGNYSFIPLYMLFQGISKALMFVSVSETLKIDSRKGSTASLIFPMILIISSLTLAGMPGFNLLRVKIALFNNIHIVLLSTFITSAYIARFIKITKFASHPKIKELLILPTVILLLDTTVPKHYILELMVVLLGIVFGKLIESKRFEPKEMFFSLEANLIYLIYLTTILTIIIVR